MNILRQARAIVDSDGSAGQENVRALEGLSLERGQRLRAPGGVGELKNAVIVFHHAVEGVVGDGAAVGGGEVAVGIPGVVIEAVVEQVAVGVVADLARQGAVVVVGGRSVAAGAGPGNAAALGDIAEGIVTEGLGPCAGGAVIGAGVPAPSLARKNGASPVCPRIIPLAAENGTQ